MEKFVVLAQEIQAGQAFLNAQSFETSAKLAKAHFGISKDVSPDNNGPSADSHLSAIARQQQYQPLRPLSKSQGELVNALYAWKDFNAEYHKGYACIKDESEFNKLRKEALSEMWKLTEEIPELVWILCGSTHYSIALVLHAEKHKEEPNTIVFALTSPGLPYTIRNAKHGDLSLLLVIPGMSRESQRAVLRALHGHNMYTIRFETTG